MNFCKDCKHASFSSLDGSPWGTPKCIHPLAPVDPVHGMKSAYCDTLRCKDSLIDPRCGPEGEWFEQKDPSEYLHPYWRIESVEPHPLSPATSAFEKNQARAAWSPGFLKRVIEAVFG